MKNRFATCPRVYINAIVSLHYVFSLFRSHQLLLSKNLAFSARFPVFPIIGEVFSVLRKSYFVVIPFDASRIFSAFDRFITDDFPGVLAGRFRILRDGPLGLPSTIPLIDCFCPRSRRRRAWFFAKSDVIQFWSSRLVRARIHGSNANNIFFRNVKKRLEECAGCAFCRHRVIFLLLYI